MTTNDREKLNRLIAGSREIVDYQFLDAASQTDYGSEIRSAWNRNRCGVHDAYVAWIQESAKPTDLEFLPNMMAVGSK